VIIRSFQIQKWPLGNGKRRDDDESRRCCEERGQKSRKTREEMERVFRRRQLSDNMLIVLGSAREWRTAENRGMRKRVGANVESVEGMAGLARDNHDRAWSLAERCAEHMAILFLFWPP